jgi:hypothetical protein
MVATWPEQRLFLERNVVLEMARVIDATVDDPAVPKWSNFSVSLDDIY